MARSAEGGVEADQYECYDDNGCTCEYEPAEGEWEAACAERENGERGSEDEHAAAVCARLAPPDRDERQPRQWNEPAPAPHEDRGEHRREEQRLDLIADPVEATAPVWTGAEHTQGIQLGIDGKHGGERGEEGGDCERHESPPCACDQRESCGERGHGREDEPEASGAGPGQQERCARRSCAAED